LKDKTARIWELKQAAKQDTLELYIYGDVQGDYFDWWTWEEVESETSANHFRNELAKYPDAKEIIIYINSYGGSVFEGTAIYSQLRRHPAQKTVYVDGFAASVASVIAMAGDKVIMPKNTMMMIHNMWNCVCGNARQLRKAADDLDTIMEGNRQAYLQKSNEKISEEKLVELLDAETWLTAEQCIEYGFADELLEKEADMTQAKQLLQKMNQSIQQQLSYNKAMAAQYREMVSEPLQKVPHKEPNPPKDPKPPKENKTAKLMAALFR
jgi:ATP-dependent protease ClpP protease subunit